MRDEHVAQVLRNERVVRTPTIEPPIEPTPTIAVAAPSVAVRTPPATPVEPTRAAKVADVELPPMAPAANSGSNLQRAQAAVAALDAKAEFRAIDGSLERVTVDQKRMINCRADLNQ